MLRAMTPRAFGGKCAMTVIFSFSVLACSKQAPPLYASSAGQGIYAVGYVDSLSSARAEVAAIEAQVETARGELPQYPAALSTPSWSDVRVVYGTADEAGRTAAYVEAVESSEGVARFYVEEKDELSRRVGGAAQHAVKQKNCDVEVYGPTTYALSKGMEERLRDRLRDRNEAQAYLDDHEDALGKKNRPKLEDQIDAISRTSYLARVAILRVRDRLARQVGEASDVKKTLERVAEDAHKKSSDGNLPAAQRSDARDREQKALSASQRLEPEVAEAKKLVDQMDQRAKAVREKYEAAIAALLKDVEARGGK